jgi:hypothetical protein
MNGSPGRLNPYHPHLLSVPAVVCARLSTSPESLYHRVRGEDTDTSTTSSRLSLADQQSVRASCKTSTSTIHRTDKLAPWGTPIDLKQTSSKGTSIFRGNSRVARLYICLSGQQFWVNLSQRLRAGGKSSQEERILNKSPPENRGFGTELGRRVGRGWRRLYLGGSDRLS